MIQFDARTAKGLKPGDLLTFEQCPGLRLVATATRRTWTYRYKSPVDGLMRQVRVGHWPALSAAAAVLEWERLRALRDGGQDPAADKRQSRLEEREQARTAKAQRAAAAYTVRRVADDYMAGHVLDNVKPKTAAEIGRTFDTMLGTVADDVAAELTRAQAFDLIDGYRATPVQAARLRQQLGAAWDYALDAGRLPDNTPNWWRLIMRGRLPSKGKRIAGKHIGETKRALSDVEAGELIRWLPNFTKLIDDVLTLYLWTLCRGAEIVAMEADELSEERSGLWWTIPKSKLKMMRHPLTTDLRVPLVGRAEAVVRRRLAEHPKGWLFPATGVDGHVEQKTIQSGVYWHQPYSQTRPEAQRQRLPVTHWSPHDLRRTGRTMLSALGCPSEVGEVILGHLPPGVEPVYNRYHYDPERRQWLGRLSAHLEQLASGKARRRR